MGEQLITQMKYYGISPWEIEAAYSSLDARFKVKQLEIEQDDSDFVSSLSILIPLAFNQAFFKWFEFSRWEKMKFLFKEMKRRRGKGHALKIEIKFIGNPNINFIADSKDNQWFNHAIEKIDSVLELLPYHLDPKKIPNGITEATYLFDENAVRWKLNTVYVGNKKYVFKDNSWKIIT